MDTKKMLLEFSGKAGVSGTESQAAEYGKKLLSKYGKTHVTTLGSVVCTVNEPKENGLHLMLDAHIDEIGMIVTYIEDKGFLRVGACGGIDRRLLLASPVTVHSQNGGVGGIVCSIPPHLTKEGDNKNKKVDEIYIDIGAENKSEALSLVSLGDRITIDSTPKMLLNGIVSGKALDDRAGCVSLIKALEYLKEPVNIGLSVVFSSMEEVGGQGARTAAYELNPTHAVAVDVSFAYTPDSQKEKCGEMKKGPMIGFAPVLDGNMSRRLCDLADENDIPYTTEVMGGKTGTNADAIVTCRVGVKMALVSVPQKYMHTPNECVAVEDVENTGRLLAKFIETLFREESR